MGCDKQGCRHDEGDCEAQRALVVRGEDATLIFELKDEYGNDFNLVGCTGVSGQFANADQVNWITVSGTVSSYDAGIVQVFIAEAISKIMLVGASQKVQLLLMISGLLRKVQFDCALDVVDDLTANPPPTPGNGTSWC